VPARGAELVNDASLVWLDIAGRHPACPTAKASGALGAGLLAALYLCVEQSFERRPEPRERLVDGLTHYVGAHSDVLIGQEVAHVDHIPPGHVGLGVSVRSVGRALLPLR
jgi:hypothetical protein